MASQIRGADGGEGLGKALKDVLPAETKIEKANTLVLVNKAGDSKSPYVRAHSSNPVAWQLWSEETISRARIENRLLFISIGYSACHCE